MHAFNHLTSVFINGFTIQMGLEVAGSRESVNISQLIVCLGFMILGRGAQDTLSQSGLRVVDFRGEALTFKVFSINLCEPCVSQG
jgi:hypothetical protein